MVFFHNSNKSARIKKTPLESLAAKRKLNQDSIKEVNHQNLALKYSVPHLLVIKGNLLTNSSLFDWNLHLTLFWPLRVISLGDKISPSRSLSRSHSPSLGGSFSFSLSCSHYFTCFITSLGIDSSLVFYNVQIGPILTCVLLCLWTF